MDQVKIGSFIAACRKNKGLTQRQLADRLGITDRAVSKWETGRSLPDASLMLELCGALDISVNELLSGEELEMTDYNEKAEQNLVELKQQKEEADKRLLTLEYVIGFTASIQFFALIFTASFIEMQSWLRALLITVAIAVFVVGMYYSLKIEQVAGYYECQKCHHKYVPTYAGVLFSMHINRTRYMKCPHCQQRSWQKKVIHK